MSDEEKMDPRRAYIITCRQLLSRWKRANLGETVCIDLAVKGAKEKYPLDESQQRDVDEFLRDELEPRAGFTHSIGAGEVMRADYEID
jgi:hypothetical protein